MTHKGDNFQQFDLNPPLVFGLFFSPIFLKKNQALYITEKKLNQVIGKTDLCPGNLQDISCVTGLRILLGGKMSQDLEGSLCWLNIIATAISDVFAADILVHYNYLEIQALYT